MPITPTISVSNADLDGISIHFYKAADGTKHVSTVFGVRDSIGHLHSFSVDKRIADVTSWTAGDKSTLQTLLSAWLTEARADLNLQP